MIQRRLPKLRGRTTVSSSECGTKMAVAGEAEMQAQCGQIVILREEIQGPRQSKTQLVAIQRHTFHLLEDLCEIDRGAAHISSNLSQRPSPCQIARQHEFGPVHQLLTSDTGSSCVRGAGPQRALHQGQGNALCLQRLRDVPTQAMPQQRDEQLSSRINAKTLSTKCERRAVAQIRTWCQFVQQRFTDG